MDQTELAEQIAEWLDRRDDIHSAEVLPDEKNVVGVTDDEGRVFFVEVQAA